jgi:glycosyltransferase involved in cell wall biosynthesis
MKNILIISAFNSIDKNKSSGTPYYISEILKKRGNHVEIGKHYPKVILVLIVIYYRIKKYITGRNQLAFMNKLLVFVAKYIYPHKYLSKYDLIVAPWGSSVLSGINTNVDILYITDATLKSMINYNSSFCNLSPNTIKQAEKIESSAIFKSSLITVPSNWAYSALITHYGVNPNKIVLAEYGPNLDEEPSLNLSVKLKSKSKKLKLLFVGKGWHNKGADKAIETLQVLDQWKIEAELYIIGSHPPREFVSENIITIPILNKNFSDDKAKLNELYSTSHFFILPTRSECFGIVFSEASAYGVPILATDTGGVSNAVINGENGFLFKFDAPAIEYAQVIKRYWEDKAEYEKLVYKTRACYENNLNWDTWYNKVFNHLDNMER